MRITTANQNTTKDPKAKAAAISILSRGLATKSEVARLAGISKQLMHHWAKEVPVDRARNTVLTKLWHKELARKR
jgi:predicted transcriptional regulator